MKYQDMDPEELADIQLLKIFIRETIRSKELPKKTLLKIKEILNQD